MGRYSPNLGLYMPDIGEKGWGDKVNNNFSIIDSAISQAGGKSFKVVSEYSATQDVSEIVFSGLDIKSHVVYRLLLQTLMTTGSVQTQGLLYINGIEDVRQYYSLYRSLYGYIYNSVPSTYSEEGYLNSCPIFDAIPNSPVVCETTIALALNGQVIVSSKSVSRANNWVDSNEVPSDYSVDYVIKSVFTVDNVSQIKIGLFGDCLMKAGTKAILLGMI